MTGLLADTRVLYTILVALVGVQRLLELAISSRHRRSALARGGIEVGSGHYPAMVALHVALLVAAPAEVWFLDRPWRPWLGWWMVGVLAVAQAVRVWTLATLGERWMTRVVVVPGDGVITSGPFRWLRHPNYLAVALEVPALPLIHGATLTASLLGVANLVVLATRVRAEEAALRRHTRYDATMGNRGR